ncbi:M10 family metallopeptidase C-terminal domain-containing protein [Inquilinus limosus]|uniref:M10 family metallopeptidase C-terminal domain-containing protein n=1 Tax=Inquilinus limosus TaxID=171674 RepID=UPI003F5CEAD2
MITYPWDLDGTGVLENREFDGDAGCRHHDAGNPPERQGLPDGLPHRIDPEFHGGRRDVGSAGDMPGETWGGEGNRNDTHEGTGEADTLNGNGGNDHLYGRGGDDVLNGGGDIDMLYGDEGADQLCGGSGGDFLSGGSGNDIFVYNDVSDSRPGNSYSHDTINDFHQGEDLIDLSAIDSDATRTGTQEFTFIGAESFDGKAGELRYEHRDGDTHVLGDTNGDKVADFEIVLEGTINLEVGDFLL